MSEKGSEDNGGNLLSPSSRSYKLKAFIISENYQLLFLTTSAVFVDHSWYFCPPINVTIQHTQLDFKVQFSVDTFAELAFAHLVRVQFSLLNFCSTVYFQTLLTNLQSTLDCVFPFSASGNYIDSQVNLHNNQDCVKDTQISRNVRLAHNRTHRY